MLVCTREIMNLKGHSKVAGRADDKSFLARSDLSVHVAAPTVHARFRGPIQFGIKNHGTLPIRLRSGIRSQTSLG
ncbi:dCTP deaminase domain-containing protein [Bradyrhizobium brasilense]|uniref:dCTP deaminase domain-containing protein n=1 Tax=Bradyrhizobium brasilense TaxID=1419277 RepID=UPI0035C77699